MTETFDIAGYCRISVDEELDRDNAVSYTHLTLPTKLEV